MVGIPVALPVAVSYAVIIALVRELMLILKKEKSSVTKSTQVEYLVGGFWSAIQWWRIVLTIHVRFFFCHYLLLTHCFKALWINLDSLVATTLTWEAIPLQDAATNVVFLGTTFALHQYHSRSLS